MLFVNAKKVLKENFEHGTNAPDTFAILLLTFAIDVWVFKFVTEIEIQTI